MTDTFNAAAVAVAAATAAVPTALAARDAGPDTAAYQADPRLEQSVEDLLGLVSELDREQLVMVLATLAGVAGALSYCVSPEDPYDALRRAALVAQGGGA